MNVNWDFYLPQGSRRADHQYKDLLEGVISFGKIKKTVQLVDALTVLGPKPMRFRMKQGIPLITERDLAVKPKGKPELWKQAIGEIIAFINGAHTLEELEKFGCFWWRETMTEERCCRFGLPKGELGLGFYGNAFTNFPMRDGGGFNQIKEVVAQIKSFPETRTHFVSPWIPQYLLWKFRETTITPCHGTMYFEVNENQLSLVMTQRAGDVPLGVPFNTFQYAVLLLMVAQATNLEPYEFVHLIMDAHIYKNQIPAVMAMLGREDRKFPILKVDPQIENLFDFRMEHFSLEEYEPHEAIGSIPTNDV